MRQIHTLQLKLFNYWHLDGDHRPIQVPSRSQRLVALLALRGRQNRAQLAGTLWPDVDEHRAQASLRTAMSALHSRVPGLVEKDHGDVLLCEHVAIDIVQFRRHADQVLAGQLAVPPSTVDHPEVSGGELLPGWYDDWVFVERERTHQLRLHVLEALARELAARDAYAHALQAALKAVEIDPLRETARRAVINVHLAQGNTADALREYQRFHDLLQEELGVGPTRHLTELIAQITRRSPHVKLASAVELDAAEPPLRCKFGRYAASPQPFDHATDEGKVQAADQVGVIGGQAVEGTIGQPNRVA